MNKKGQWQLLALINPYVLLGLGIFLLLVIGGVLLFPKIIIGIFLVVVAGVLLLRGMDYRVSFVIIAVGLLFIWNPPFMNSLAIQSPRSQYIYVDADVDKQVLQADQDSVNVKVDWSTIPELGRRVKGWQVIWIYKNDVYYSRESIPLSDRGSQTHTYQVTGFNPGWNDITVKVGLGDYLDCTYLSEGTKLCGTNRYRYLGVCPHSQDLMILSDCSLVEEAFGPGDKNVDPVGLLSIDRDISSQLPEGIMHVSTFDFKVYKEKAAEIPQTPTEPIDSIEELPPQVCNWWCRFGLWFSGFFGI